MKPIPNHELYSITQDGRVFSHRKGRFMKPTVKYNGYSFVVLDKKSYPVARLVLDAFNPGEGYPNHKDYNRQNNHISNLEWITHRQIILKSRQDNYWERSAFWEKRSIPQEAKKKPVKAIGKETLKFNSVKELLEHFNINRRRFNRYMLEKKKFNNYNFEYENY